MNLWKSLFHNQQAKIHTISAEQAKTMMNQKNVVIVDVREKGEYQQGHIPQSILISLSTIHKQNPLLPDKEKTLLLYCRSGQRSAKAAKQFSELGYVHIYNFGGIIDWPYEIEK